MQISYWSYRPLHMSPTDWDANSNICHRGGPQNGRGPVIIQDQASRGGTPRFKTGPIKLVQYTVRECVFITRILLLYCA